MHEVPFMVFGILSNRNDIGWSGKCSTQIKIEFDKPFILKVNDFEFQKFRAWWIVAIVASTVMCVYSVYDVWSNWKNDPIIVNQSPKLNLINEIPFPAVSICPYVAFASDKFNFTATYRSIHKLDGNITRDLKVAEYVNLNDLIFCYEIYSREIAATALLGQGRLFKGVHCPHLRSSTGRKAWNITLKDVDFCSSFTPFVQ